MFTRAHRQIHNAAQHPVELDRAQADAVDARILLDLRIGAAFTRMQTLALQGRFAQLNDKRDPVSYGLCIFLLCASVPAHRAYRPVPIPHPRFCRIKVHTSEELQARDVLVHLPLPLPNHVFLVCTRRNCLHVAPGSLVRVPGGVCDLRACGEQPGSARRKGRAKAYQEMVCFL